MVHGVRINIRLLRDLSAIRCTLLRCPEVQLHRMCQRNTEGVIQDWVGVNSANRLSESGTT